jgi:hypothetical protein|tara:strand:- start:8968 stop:9432 length:465 start_codon:yes stop_codon:yes gene_type:complete
MATETKTQKGLTISFDDGDFTSGTVSVLLDLDMRTGTPVDETGWLNGNAGGSYPGTLTGFTAQNTDGNAVGSMRLVTIGFTLADAAEQVLVITAGGSKLIGVLGTTFAVADKTLSASFTNTGAAPAAKTGAALPAIVLHGEAAGAGTVTVMMLN